MGSKSKATFLSYETHKGENEKSFILLLWGGCSPPSICLFSFWFLYLLLLPALSRHRMLCCLSRDLTEPAGTSKFLPSPGALLKRYGYHLLTSTVKKLISPKYPLKVKVLVAQLCPTRCDPVDCSPPGSSVRGILQARILEWVAIPFSRGFS